MYLIDIIISLLYENVIRRKQPPVCVYLMLAYLLCICAEDVDYNFWFGFFFFWLAFALVQSLICNICLVARAHIPHGSRQSLQPRTIFSSFFFCFFPILRFVWILFSLSLVNRARSICVKSPHIFPHFHCLSASSHTRRQYEQSKKNDVTRVQILLEKITSKSPPAPC